MACKNRSRRNIKAVKKSTLDNKHSEMLEKFNKQYDILPDKKKKLARLKKKAKSLEKKKDLASIEHLIKLRESIYLLQKQIKSTESYSRELEYVYDTGDCLIDYYDNSEVVDCVESTILRSAPNKCGGQKSIMSYFLKEKDSSSDKEVRKKKPLKTKASVYQLYLDITDSGSKSRKKSQENCPDPKCKGKLRTTPNEDSVVCCDCGWTEPLMLATEKPNYKDPIQETGTYAYKRINHLTEILSQLQAKEQTEIPQKVFSDIETEIKKKRMKLQDLDVFKLRKILKKLDYKKYYEHVPQILFVVNGKKPPVFSRQVEGQIKKMFKDIQKPFSMYCPPSRKNFLNYSYVLHKFCELLDLREYIDYFPLLKNTTKKIEHDKIWKQICAYMGWKFNKSI